VEPQPAEDINRMRQPWRKSMNTSAVQAVPRQSTQQEMKNGPVDLQEKE
jgi:hypothetical protein